MAIREETHGREPENDREQWRNRAHPEGREDERTSWGADRGRENRLGFNTPDADRYTQAVASGGRYRGASHEDHRFGARNETGDTYGQGRAYRDERGREDFGPSGQTGGDDYGRENQYGSRAYAGGRSGGQPYTGPQAGGGGQSGGGTGVDFGASVYGQTAQGSQLYGGYDSRGQGSTFGQSDYGERGGGGLGGAGLGQDHRTDQAGRQANQGQRAGVHHDLEPDYLHWRDTQLQNFDRDYHSWRDERRTKFSNEFETWRQQRAGQHGTPTGQATSANEALGARSGDPSQTPGTQNAPAGARPSDQDTNINRDDKKRT
jgi:hypothetical protein